MESIHPGAQPAVERQFNAGRKYKSRKERPCDACRKRKICCTRDAYETACSLCRTRGETCKYVLPPNVRRNRQASAPATTSRPGSLTSRAASSSQSPVPPVPPLPASQGRQNTQPSKPLSECKPEWICQFAGLSGDQDPFVLRHCSFNHSNCYKAPGWAVLRVKGDNGIPLHFTMVPDSHLDARPNYYPSTDTETLVAPHSEDLLMTYFDVIHTSYPLLEPARFESKPPNRDLLVAIMYSLATSFYQESIPFAKPLTDSIHQALPIERRHPRLETLEASLLYLHRPPPIQHSTVLPALTSDVGALVGISHDLGLNLCPTSWNLSRSDTNRRIRIWWGVYMLDKWTALGVGRPSYLSAENSDVPLPTISNFTHQGLGGEQLGLGPALQFIAMAHLTTILSDVLATFYTLKSHVILKTYPVSTLFSLLDTFQNRLHAFHETHMLPLYGLPPLPPNPASTGGALDSTGTTILSFYTVQAVLYRAVLRVMDMNHPGYAGIRAQAKSVLVSVVSFVENLGVGSRLRAFWWCPQSRTSFSLLGTFMFYQLLTSVSNSDIEFWSHTISHYRSLLRIQSQTWEVTKLAALRMDILAQGMGIGSEDTPYSHNLQTTNAAATMAFSNEGFVNTGMMPGAADAWILKQEHEGLLTC